ncbi:solute carrier family 2 facilitated glucose transporter member 3, partial [Clonorchis sinensis]
GVTRIERVKRAARKMDANLKSMDYEMRLVVFDLLLLEYRRPRVAAWNNLPPTVVHVSYRTKFKALVETTYAGLHAGKLTTWRNIEQVYARASGSPILNAISGFNGFIDQIRYTFIIIIDSMTSVFNTDASLPYNHEQICFTSNVLYAVFVDKTRVINAPYQVFDFVSLPSVQLISDFIGNVTADRHGSADEAYVTVIASVCVSGFLIGGLAGALISGLLANKLGRKRAILVLSGPCVLGCIFIMVCQAARSFEIIIVGRLLVGVACGAYTAVGPLYMSEIVPLSVRGAAGVLNQLMIVFSLLLSQILGLQQIMGTKDLWPYLLGLNVIPCILGSALLLLCPESPRYLYIIKRDPETARAALQRLRSPDHDIDTELAGFSREASIASRKATIFELLRKPYLRIGLMVALLAQFGQQLSGINGVIYYSVELFKVNGLTDEQATYTTIGIGGFMLLITVVSIFIIDRVGRRILLIGGLAVAFLSLLSFTFCMIGKQYGQVNWPIYPAIVSIYVFVCGFGIGPGSIPWFIAAEMFSQETRDAAMGVSATTNWLCNIAVALGFIQMIKVNTYKMEFHMISPPADFQVLRRSGAVDSAVYNVIYIRCGMAACRSIELNLFVVLLLVGQKVLLDDPFGFYKRHRDSGERPIICALIALFLRCTNFQNSKHRLTTFEFPRRCRMCTLVLASSFEYNFRITYQQQEIFHKIANIRVVTEPYWNQAQSGQGVNCNRTMKLLTISLNLASSCSLRDARQTVREKYLEFYSFLPSACILLVVIVLLYIYMPETKGKSADMIEAEFRRRTNLCHRDSYDSEFAASSTSVIQAVLGPPSSSILIPTSCLYHLIVCLPSYEHLPPRLQNIGTFRSSKEDLLICVSSSFTTTVVFAVITSLSTSSVDHLKGHRWKTGRLSEKWSVYVFAPSASTTNWLTGKSVGNWMLQRLRSHADREWLALLMQRCFLVLCSIPFHPKIDWLNLCPCHCAPYRKVCSFRKLRRFSAQCALFIDVEQCKVQYSVLERSVVYPTLVYRIRVPKTETPVMSDSELELHASTSVTKISKTVFSCLDETNPFSRRHNVLNDILYRMSQSGQIPLSQKYDRCCDKSKGLVSFFADLCDFKALFFFDPRYSSRRCQRQQTILILMEGGKVATVLSKQPPSLVPPIFKVRCWILVHDSMILNLYGKYRRNHVHEMTHQPYKDTDGVATNNPCPYYKRCITPGTVNFTTLGKTPDYPVFEKSVCAITVTCWYGHSGKNKISTISSIHLVESDGLHRQF